MNERNSEEVLKIMIEILLLRVEELFGFTDKEGEQLEYGERVAYTECLEWLQTWKHSNENGLDFDIEKKYPL